jgi:hypothetical protein
MNTIIDFWNITQRPVLLFENNISEAGFCLHPKVKSLLRWGQLIELAPISGNSTHLKWFLPEDGVSETLLKEHKDA